jgi:penicillin-binding protein 1A
MSAPTARPVRAGRPARRALAAASIGALFFGSACALAPIDLTAEKPLAVRSKITAADGSELASLYRQNRVLAPLSAMPEHLVDAVLAVEDARFYQHSGYDIRSIMRAALVNAREGEIVEGGSTITQQYVKNTYFTHPPRTLKRKARELRISIEVERLYSKDEILERYLNTVYLGDGAYGMKAGAEVFFGRRLGHLRVHQSALLASVIKSPAYYNPRTEPKHARIRRNYALDRMARLGWLSERAAQKARKKPLGILAHPPQSETRNPYFVEAVKREVLRMPALGAREAERARALWTGGLRIETTLDPVLQRAAESAVAEVLNQPGDPEAALVAIRPQTGEIVAMVGGRDWGASQVNLALGRAGGGSGRQPGSAFKPIALAAALEGGVRLDDSYQSSPVSFTFEDGSGWNVRNAEGGGYGLMELDEALVHSVNGVFARLAMQIGGTQIATQASLMGVRAELAGHPSIVLGSEEVSVLDMAAAYATLANNGTAVEPTTVKEVHLPSGEVLRPEQEAVPFAVSPGNAYLITKTLERVITEGTGTAAGIGRPAAGKTGTTNNYTDAWFVGYTPELVAAVWVGHPEGLIPMTSVHGIRVFGGTFPALIWRSFMSEATAGSPVRGFPVPRGELVTLEIDPVTGLLAAPWCPGEPERVLRQLAPTEYCPQPVPEPEPSPTPSPSGDDKDSDDKDSDGKDPDEKDPDGKDADEKDPDEKDPDGQDGGGGKDDPDPKPTPSPSP